MQDASAEKLYELRSREYIERCMLGRLGVDVQFPVTDSQAVGIATMLGFDVEPDEAYAIMRAAAAPTDEGLWLAAAVVELLASLHRRGDAA